MGMHIGLIAAQTTTAGLRDAFFQTWTAYEATESQEGFKDEDAVWAWKESHSEFVSAANWSKENPGKEVYLFWQDGPWAVVTDLSYVLPSDKTGLGKLSLRVGRVLSFIVETAAGCASFYCIEDGGVRRSIDYADGKADVSGEPLAEEAGIDMDRYYMEETETLWRSFGLREFHTIPNPAECLAVCVIDRTDYGQLIPARPVKQQDPSPSKRRWWQIWRH